jgi:AraC-like DNA-binding protein
VYREQPSLVPGGVIWSSRSTGEGVRVLPDGCMDLLWDGSAILIAGPDTRAHVFRSARGSPMVGLRFAPGFAPRVLGAPADEFVNQRVPLDAVWSPDEARLITDLLAASSDPAATLEDVALRRCTPSDDAALIDDVVSLARAGCTSTRIAREVGYSPRQLQRRSTAAFGYGTKTLHRILRMHRALDLIRRGARTADSAVRAGYADQPHLSREIRAMAGVPLTELMA